MIVGILQARMSSSRLPGKVLKPILGRPMLDLHIERLCRAKRLDALVVATSSDVTDDPIAHLCNALGVPLYRGSLTDVLDRYHQAALAHHASHVVRLTGDCPLADPDVIDRLIALHLSGGYDYSSNFLEPSYPNGLEAEIMTRDALEIAWREAKLPSEREHVTMFIYKNEERFRLGGLKQNEDQSAMRWTVDHPEDFEVVRHVYEALYPLNRDFSSADILGFLLRHPEVAALNARYRRNEALAKSFEADRAFLAAEAAHGL